MNAWIRRRHRISLSGAVAILTILSLGVVFLLFYISPLEGYVFNSLMAWSKGLVLLVNWLPVFLFMLLFYFLTGNLVASSVPVALVAVVMAVVNRVKISLRGDPLLHWDISMAGEALGISEAFDTGPFVMAAIGLGVIALLSIPLAFVLRTQKPEPRVRAMGAVGTVALMLVLNFTLYSSSAVESKLPVWGSFYNMTDVHNSKGNLYSFLYNWNTSRKQQPEGYSENEHRAFADEYTQGTEPAVMPEVLPNIVLVMGEAFSDLSELPAFSFDGFRDPLRGFKSLAEEGISGHLVVPSRGGGTSDTEYDVLTARPSRLSRSAPYAYRMLVGPIEAMPSLLGGVGYTSFALHPGYPWFYNRQNVYPYLGFDEAIFEDAFPKEAYKDTFITEQATMDMFLGLLDEKKTDAPMLAFCLTIQNHAPYADRFLPAGTDAFTSNLSLTDAERNTLSNYFAAMADADDHLMRLAAYLEAQDEPYILVYWGDHLPAFDEALYDKILPADELAEGSCAYETRCYKTPFLIWQNSAARELTPWDENATSGMPQDMTISSNYLGAYLMELLGLDSLSSYWSFANEVRRDAPIVMESVAFGPDGEVIEDAADTLVRTFRHWVYSLPTG